MFDVNASVVRASKLEKAFGGDATCIASKLVFDGECPKWKLEMAQQIISHFTVRLMVAMYYAVESEKKWRRTRKSMSGDGSKKKPKWH